MILSMEQISNAFWHNVKGFYITNNNNLLLRYYNEWYILNSNHKFEKLTNKMFKQFCGKDIKEIQLKDEINFKDSEKIFPTDNDWFKSWSIIEKLKYFRFYLYDKNVEEYIDSLNDNDIFNYYQLFPDCFDSKRMKSNEFHDRLKTIKSTMNKIILNIDERKNINIDITSENKKYISDNTNCEIINFCCKNY